MELHREGHLEHPAKVEGGVCLKIHILGYPLDIDCTIYFWDKILKEVYQVHQICIFTI